MMKNVVFQVLSEAAKFSWQTLQADSGYLFFSILIAVALTVYLDPKKTQAFFMRKTKFLVAGSVGFGALTPLCACGTMAVVISLLTTALPWGPIMAFLVSSPLMSPDTFVLLSGILGFKFALSLAVSSVVIGLAAGYLTVLIEKRTLFLDNQFRIPASELKKDSPVCCQEVSFPTDKWQVAGPCGCSNAGAVVETDTSWINAGIQLLEKWKIGEFLRQFYLLGIKKIIPLFLLFVVISFLVKNYVPTEWTVRLFKGNNLFSVPLAALVGLPLYVSDSAIVPLLQVLKEGGASDGSLLAFMISGPGTSLAVLIGLNVVMKKRALLLYVLYIFLGAVLLGYAYDYLNTLL